jgi:hypothetical protein
MGEAEEWSEADLIGRLARALDFAVLTIKSMPAEGFADQAEPSRTVRPEKVVGETSLLLLVAAQASSSVEVRRRIDVAAQLILPLARAERVRARVCLEPSLALEHALGHICLSRLGFPDLALDRLLHDALEADCAGGVERTPHRELEQEWLVRMWGGNARRAHVDPRLPGRSALGRPADLLSTRKDQTYAFTHALMYLTDFGAREVRLPRSAAALAAEAEAALASSLDEPDYDVAGELLLTSPYLRRRWSAPSALGFAILASVEDRLGFLPSPSVSLDRLQGLAGEERTRYAAANSYHTAFVMGVLCAAALRGDRRPPVRPPARARQRGAAGELLALIGPVDAKAEWKAHIESLPPDDRDAAAPLLLAIGLRRAAVRRDLAAVRSALLIGQRHGLLDAPAPRQAAQLLRRSATFAALKAGAAKDEFSQAAAGQEARPQLEASG